MVLDRAPGRVRFGGVAIPEATEPILELLARLRPALTPTGYTDPPPSEPLFHYTGSAGLEGILRTKTIRATHFMHLNDRDEVTAGEKLVCDVVQALGATKPRGSVEWNLCQSFVEFFLEKPLTKLQDIYVASFSQNGNDLSQWRAYGASGGGYSIGFRRLRFHPPVMVNPTHAIGIERVEYDEEAMRERVRTVFARVVAAALPFWSEAVALGQLAKRYAFVAIRTELYHHACVFVSRYKNVAFAPEEEWRIVAGASLNLPPGTLRFDHKPSGVVPYLPIALCAEETMPLDITKIWVGPTLDPARAVHAARLLAKDVGIDPELVEHSGIPLRW
jgi:hypothetical protein